MTSDKEKWNEDYLRASARVKEIKGFYTNLVAYLVVIPFLIFVNYMTFWDYHWFWFPIFGWGLGLAIHGLVTFGVSAEWEKRKIKELMDKDKYN
jgi:two-component system LytT family sensor kinase